jgi:hypothetical protein
MAQEKLRYGVTGMGHNATACEHYTPRKRDFPTRKVSEVCSGCGAGIEPAIAKLVICVKCGTKYKPLNDRILVLYNYEHISREKYMAITGKDAPSGLAPKASITQEEALISQRKSVIVLYPTESVKLGSEGIRISREGIESFERYDQIYQIVDYGSLSERKASRLEKKGVKLVRRPIATPRQPMIPSLLSSAFEDKIRLLRKNPVVMQSIAQSMMVSVMIATKRILELGGSRVWLEPLQRQFVEYARMKQKLGWNLDNLLAYEARSTTNTGEPTKRNWRP